jgi:hypothetical protein
MSRTIKEEYDGKLCVFLSQAMSMTELTSCKFINTPSGITTRPTLQHIATCRNEGCHWLWSMSDIMLDKESNEYYLPSVDIGKFFDVTNHNKIKEWMHDKNINPTGYIMDTEKSAWYPRFETRKIAIRCIKEIDEVFDEEYLYKTILPILINS